MGVDRDEERDERIEMEIIVDTYGAEEQAMGWNAYLDDTLEFPFEARCRTEREESPLEEGEPVRVVGMPTTDSTLSQQFVTIEWKNRELGVPLKQLEPVDASNTTEQAVADWHYWLKR
ncbi:calcium-binding protein [Halococcus sediminicola]|uniref:calcium-binding protein n=1 Tax=Halococcus sediminicola TaxID=1264579 RepID=UPI000679E565|nr:calcium-binding protein [Halococcus sediminicola]